MIEDFVESKSVPCQNGLLCSEYIHNYAYRERAKGGRSKKKGKTTTLNYMIGI